MYDKLVAKVNNIDASGFVLKTKHDIDKSCLEQKIPDTSEFVKKTDNAKITWIEGKIPSINGIATNSALAAVENKIPDFSNLDKKQIMIQKCHTLNLNILLQLIIINLTNDIVANKIKSEGLVDKSTISGLINNTDLNKISNISNKSLIKSIKRQNNKITSIWFKLF